MTADWKNRRDAAMPFQTWMPFPPDTIVEIKNAFGDSQIGPAKAFWWGYEEELGCVGEGVITAARRLDREKPHDRA